MEDFPTAAVFIVGAIALMAVLVFVGRLKEKKRTEALREVAANLSFEFADSDEQLLSHLGSFPLFSQGSSRKMKNVLRGTSSNTEVSFFDYQYTTSGGDDSTTHQQTGICFRSERLQLPNFELRPEYWYHKIGNIFGYQDINFDDYPEFSRRYLLRSDDEDGALFTASAIEHLEGQSDICAEGRDDRLIVYRAGTRVKPLELPDFLATGFDVFAAFTRESDV